MEGLAEFLAEQNGNGAAKFWKDVATNDPVPRGFVRVDGDRYVFAALGKVGRSMKLKDVCATLEEMGLDPIREVVTVLQSKDKDRQLSTRDQVDTCLKLAEFVHPKLSRSELTGAGGGAIEFSATERAARAAALLDIAGVRRAGSLALGGAVGTAAGPADGGVPEQG